jgi:hypothetical protein
MIRSRKVLNSAKGQPCSARFPGICNGNAETTVWAHLNGAAFGKGMGIKAHDVLGFHACFDCHSYYDTGHGTKPLLTNDELLGYILSAVCETWVRLITSGIVVVPVDVETPRAERPTKPRLPKADRKQIKGRTEIPSRGFGNEHRPMRRNTQ